MTVSAPRGSYPHPVLDVSDDVASYFEVSNAQVLPGFEDVGITFDLRTDDPTLKRLLDSGKARLSLRWRCSATLATDECEPTARSVLADGYRYEFWLDQKQVRGAVAVEVRTLVVQPLTGFQWDRQHPDYGNATFDLGVGDVLADGGSFNFEADKLYDPLDPPIGTCFKFVQDPSLRRGMKVTFEQDDTVLVRLPPDVHSNFGLLAARPELQISFVVLPALIQTIGFIQAVLKDESEDLGDRIWFRVIRGAVERFGGFDGVAIELAQQILDYPLDRALSLEADAEDDE